MIIKLDTVVYDIKARGPYCRLPYPNHPKGCPRYPKCILERKDFTEYKGYQWYAVIEEFDLKEHARKMKEKHQRWTERQCRNLLYWQGGVRKRLREKAQKFSVDNDVILDIPEANGVNLFKTMELHNITLERHRPQTVRKIMLVGKRI